MKPFKNLIFTRQYTHECSLNWVKISYMGVEIDWDDERRLLGRNKFCKGLTSDLEK